MKNDDARVNPYLAPRYNRAKLWVEVGLIVGAALLFLFGCGVESPTTPTTPTIDKPERVAFVVAPPPSPSPSPTPFPSEALRRQDLPALPNGPWGGWKLPTPTPTPTHAAR